MKVLKIKYEIFDGVGAFAVLPEKSSPSSTIDFALCQICRIRYKDEKDKEDKEYKIIYNPSIDPNIGDISPFWDPESGEARIKEETLTVENGWFIDHFFRGPGQNCLYYMESFNDTRRQDLLTNVNQNNSGGVLYGANNAENILKDVYTQQYQPHIVTVANNDRQYPFLYDSPQQDGNTKLDFQVYLIYRRQTPQQTLITVGQGFEWRFEQPVDAPSTSSFVGILNDATPEFLACLQLGIELQNEVNNSNWILG